MDTKTKKRIPLGTPRYHRLTSENRITIRALGKEGFSKSAIARHVGCDRSTVGRELERNERKKGYRPKKAQGMADARVRTKAAGRRKLTEPMWKTAMEKLGLGWTFEQISGRAKRDGEPTVCKETFYKEYYRRQKLVRNGESDEMPPPLPRRQKKRRTRDRDARKYRNAGRGRIKDRVDIDERPKAVENRARVGHWVADTPRGLYGTAEALLA